MSSLQALSWPYRFNAYEDISVQRKSKRTGLRQGTAVVWPSGVEDRYGISAPTRWRWEKRGRLPPRDVNVGGKTGWRPSTLEAGETSRLPSLSSPSLAGTQK